MTTTASVLTISAFTAERYLAICHPLRAQTTYRLERAARVIVAIWLVAGSASIPFPVNTRTFHYVVDPRDGRPLADSFVCNIPPGRMATMKTVFLASTFALFVVPMLVIVGLYTAIGLTLRRRARVELAAAGDGRGDGRRVRIEMLPMRGRPRHAINRLGCGRRPCSSSSVYISGRQAVLKVLGLLSASLQSRYYGCGAALKTPQFLCHFDRGAYFMSYLQVSSSSNIYDRPPPNAPAYIAHFSFSPYK